MTVTRYEWRRRRVATGSRAAAPKAIGQTKYEQHGFQSEPYLNRFGQRALAWILAEIATPYLSRERRLWLCASIGAGELESALVMLLDCCATRNVALPEDVLETVGKWLAGYAGTDVAVKFALYPGPIT
jgi:hypothetical protein